MIENAQITGEWNVVELIEIRSNWFVKTRSTELNFKSFSEYWKFSTRSLSGLMLVDVTQLMLPGGCYLVDSKE